MQPDENVVMGGSYSTNSASGLGLARVNPSGALDSTFGTKGLVTTFTSGGEITVLFIQGGGNILAIGVTSGSGGTDALTLVRYRAK
ncbi:MAG: hypothetical protein H0X25_07130 [Acidobacteriales bacterium]|nr:hypothetical protein [Terriglobales bacterium]